MDTTLSSTARIHSAARSGAGLRRSLASVLGRMQTAIVNGPSDGLLALDRLRHTTRTASEARAGAAARRRARPQPALRRSAFLSEPRSPSFPAAEPQVRPNTYSAPGPLTTIIARGWVPGHFSWRARERGRRSPDCASSRQHARAGGAHSLLLTRLQAFGSRRPTASCLQNASAYTSVALHPRLVGRESEHLERCVRDSQRRLPESMGCAWLEPEARVIPRCPFQEDERTSRSLNSSMPRRISVVPIPWF